MKAERTYIFAGASSGIALASLRQLQSEGHRVIGISRQVPDSGYAVGHQVKSYAADSLPDIAQPVSGLAYFPGSILLKPFHRISSDEWKTLYQIHVGGAIEVLRKYYPLLKQSADGASVILFSSVAAGTGMPFHAGVASMKAAVEGLARSLAAEWAPQIRVNVLALSLTDTPMAGNLLQTPEKREAAALRHPLRRTGSPEDIAQAVSFLADPARSGWISGQIISVDGGIGALRTG